MTLYSYYANLSGEVTESEETWAYDVDGNVVSYTNDSDEGTYGLKNLYDELERSTSSVIDLDFDTIEDYEWVWSYSGDEWPWSYTAELNDLFFEETVQSEEGVYTCE